VKYKSTKKIAIIGPYPPPYGGISTHINRVIEHLDNNDIDYVFYNESSNKFHRSDKKFNGIARYFKTLLFLFSRYSLIHHHSPDKYVRLLLCGIGRFKNNIYLHIHGESLKDDIEQKGILSLLIKRLLRNVHILADNDEIYNYLRRYSPRTINIIDAFIPPSLEIGEFKIFKDSLSLIDADIVLTTMGWFRRYKNEDLYGFDILLDALNTVNNSLKESIVIIARVNGIIDNDIYDCFLAKRKALKLENNFVLLEDDYQTIWPLYLVGQVFIRATNTDGNSVSLKEALWFNSQVIASDCIVRPEGVNLFKNRDSNDLAKQITKVITKKMIPTDERIKSILTKKYKYKLFEDIYELE